MFKGPSRMFRLLRVLSLPQLAAAKVSKSTFQPKQRKFRRHFKGVTTAVKAHQLKIKSASDHNRDARRFGHGARREPRCWHQQRYRTPHTRTNYSQLADPKRD